MHFPVRPFIVGAALIAFSAVLLGYAQAGGGHFYPPVTDKVVAEECGGCHMAYPPSMLPARSWQRMMSGLDQHFGDNASLDPTLAAQVGRYLADNAADAAGSPYGGKLTRKVATGATPQRITELPSWVNAHRKVPEWEWVHADVRTKANCAACHDAALRGYFNG
jgi:hypothetical protein